jgi:hypothetical protein
MKKHIQQLKDSREVSHLVLNKEEFDRIEWENQNEFSYKGEMYDLLEKHTEGNQLSILCIADKKESKLIEAYQKLNQKNIPPGSSPSEILLKLAAANYLLPNAINNLALQQDQSVTWSTYFNYRLPFYFPTIHTPPPQEES